MSFPIFQPQKAAASGGGGNPTVVASNSLAGSDWPSITVNNPTNVSGDILFYFITSNKTKLCDTPTGLTLVTTITNAGATNSTTQVFTKTSGGSEPSTVVFDGTGGTWESRDGIVVSVRNAPGTVTPGANNPLTSTTITALSITATLNSLVFEVYEADWAITKAGTLQAVANGSRNIALVSNEGVSAGATGNQTATTGTSDGVGAMQIEVLK